MKITKVCNIYQMTFFPTLFPVNCYLVEEDKELTLIDAAFSFSAKKIVETATKIGKPITNIILTHAHGDHVGALDSLVRQLPKANILLSKRDSKILKGDVSLEEHEIGYPIKGGIPKNVSAEPNVFLKEGDKVGSLITIETPGHTPGSLSFLDERSGCLVVGDQFQTRGGFAISGQFRPFFPFPSFATWHKEKALQSAKKLLEYHPKYLFVGHGPIIENPTKKMEQLIKKGI